MIGRMMNDQVTILRAPVVTSTRYGSRSRGERDWSHAERTAARANVQPGTATEAEAAGDGRDAVTTSIRVWLPRGTDVLATDRIEWDGRTWEVLGEPQRFDPPRGTRLAHVRLTAQQVTG